MPTHMPYVVRPLEPWLDPFTTYRDQSRFRAPWSSTLDMLDREIHHLGGTSWVLQIDVPERMINRNGTLSVRAVPVSPAVRVCLTSRRHGPMTYAMDRYLNWQSNIRAIALTLEALRAVSRYGVASSGEQYRGWQAISNRPAGMSREQAAELLAHWAGLGTTLGLFDGYPAAVTAAYRAAAKRVHPDVTGDDGDTMARLNVARDLLLNGRTAG